MHLIVLFRNRSDRCHMKRAVMQVDQQKRILGWHISLPSNEIKVKRLVMR